MTRPKPKPLKLSERDISATCVDFMILDGWRHLRTDPVSDRATVNTIRRAMATISLPPHVRDKINGIINKSVRGKGFGEVGMADSMFIRYLHRDGLKFEREDVELIWCEFKALKGKPSPEQIAWIAQERVRGALVWLAGLDFPATIEGFRAHYIASGLARRVTA